MARTPHYLREWRLQIEPKLTLERVAELLGERGYETTYATLSRIERGLIPYNQDLLDLLARIYQAPDAAALLRPPGGAELVNLMKMLPERDQEFIVDTIRSRIERHRREASE